MEVEELEEEEEDEEEELRGVGDFELSSGWSAVNKTIRMLLRNGQEVGWREEGRKRTVEN